MINLTVISIAILGFLVSTLKSFIQVAQDEQAVIERLGKFDRVLGPGVHFIFPYIERPVGITESQKLFKFFCKDRISLSEQVMEFPNDNRAFFANNNEQLKVKGELVYQITDPYKAVYEIAYLLDAMNQLAASIIQKRLIEESIDSDPIQKLKDISEHILDLCNEYSVKWGVKIKDIKIKQIIDSNGIRHNFKY